MMGGPSSMLQCIIHIPDLQITDCVEISSDPLPWGCKLHGGISIFWIWAMGSGLLPCNNKGPNALVCGLATTRGPTHISNT